MILDVMQVASLIIVMTKMTMTMGVLSLDQRIPIGSILLNLLLIGLNAFSPASSLKRQQNTNSLAEVVIFFPLRLNCFSESRLPLRAQSTFLSV